ncbi:MAG: YkgJ family cysteine cluster protein [Candidatus Solibacter sp.]
MTALTRIRFECQPGCTECCRQQGFVYLSEADVERAAKYVGMTRARFERKYVYRTANRLRLRVPRRTHCHFLHEGGCGIHPAKPTQCRTFPFWPEIVDHPKMWAKTAKYCPGLGKGPLIQISAALAGADEMRKALPKLYPPA